MTIQLFIGAPGTGKSYLLKQMASKKENPIILAPTWYCANKINGRTIYNYCNSSFMKFIPKKFTSSCVFIDEIFMFSKREMQRVLECKNEFTQFFLFGDPYQIKPPNNDGYFWEALDQEPKITYLTNFYRSAEDKKLQQILNDYRIEKRINITNMFQLINIKEASQLNMTILVGTHQAANHIQQEIQKNIPKCNIIYGPDGNKYRKNQTLFSISKYGSIQEKLQLVRFDCDQMIVKNENQKFFSIDPIKKQKITYPIISGDVITVNIAQGQEFDKVIIDSSSFFEFGSLYTALSRTKTFNDIYILKRNNFDKVFEVDLQNPYCLEKK